MTTEYRNAVTGEPMPAPSLMTLLISEAMRMVFTAINGDIDVSRQQHEWNVAMFAFKRELPPIGQPVGSTFSATCEPEQLAPALDGIRLYLHKIAPAKVALPVEPATLAEAAAGAAAALPPVLDVALPFERIGFPKYRVVDAVAQRGLVLPWTFTLKSEDGSETVTIRTDSRGRSFTGLPAIRNVE